MSWKSLVTAGLLCVLASPVMAVDPVLSVTKGGTQGNNYLNANGDWVWNILISNSNPIPTGSSPLAAELGFTTSTALKGASNLSTGSGDDFDTANPGTIIFGWETLTDVGGGNMRPVGLQSNCASGCSTTGATNQVFSALGSINYNSVGPHDYIQIISRGPSAGAGGVLASSVTTSGVYGVGSNKGRIAEITGASTSANFDTFANVFTRTAIAGDANMNGLAADDDLNIVLANFNGTGKKWFEGNFDNHSNSDVNDQDLNILLANFNGAGAIGNGAGLSSGGAVPEPAAITLIALAFLSSIGFLRRLR